LGGIMVSKAAGYLFDYYKSLHDIETGYFIVFIYCGLAYVSAWIVMHLLVPRMKRVEK